MNTHTRRRVLAAAGAVAGVGGASYLLNRDRRERRHLGMAADPAGSAFAYVGGLARPGADGRMDLDVAVRNPADEDRTVELFADSDHARDLWFPALRGLWRFDVDVSAVPPGTYAVRLGDAALDVDLGASVPPDANPVGGERFLPKAAWRSLYVAYASAYLTSPGEWVLTVAFRGETGTADAPLDELAVRAPDGTELDSLSVPAGTWNATLSVDAALDPLEYVTLVVRNDGGEFDSLRIDHFG